MDLLAVLISRAGELVAKEDLLREVWPDTIVEDNNLARHVSMLRKALQDTADHNHYIVTVQGRGYRFVAPVASGDEVDLVAPATTPEPLPAPALALAPAPAPAAASRAQLDTPVAAPRRLRVVHLLTGGLVLLLVATVAWLARGPRAAPVQRVLSQLTYEPGLQIQPAWSPDGRRLAYASDQSGNFDIWVRTIGAPAEIRVTRSPAAEWQPAWSRDGRWLAYRSERDGGGLYIASADGGSERRLAPFGFRPQWSPSGESILFSGSAFGTPSGSLYLVGRDGGEPREFRPPAIAQVRNAHAAWLPDADRISIWGIGAGGTRTFFTITVESGAVLGSAIPKEIERSIQEAGVTLGRFIWSPSKRYLFFEGRSHEVSGVWRVRVEPRTLAWIAGPERLTTDNSDGTEMALSADGTRLAFSSQQDLTRLWAFPLDLAAGRLTGSGRPLTSGGAGEFDAAAPSDGRKVAYRRIREGRQELWEQATDGSDARLLLATREANVSSPRWSMDGRLLAFFSSPRPANGSAAAATVILSPATGAQRILPTPPGSSLVPDDWSADGDWILGACRYTAGQPLGICAVSTSDPAPAAGWRVLATDAGKALLSPRFSPDQRWISFMAVERSDTSVSTIYVMPASGGAWIPVTDGRSYDDKPRWAPDGSAVYFVSSAGGIANVMARRVDPAAATPSGPAFAVTNFDTPQRMLPPLGRMEISVASRELFVPVTEARGHVWLLDRVDR